MLFRNRRIKELLLLIRVGYVYVWRRVYDVVVGRVRRHCYELVVARLAASIRVCRAASVATATCCVATASCASTASSVEVEVVGS